MAQLYSMRRAPLWIWAALLAIAATAPAPAAESVRDTSSLRLVPEDASFYWARLRMREQYDAVMNSKAVARLVNMPIFQKAREKGEELQKEAGTPDVSQWKELLELPENKALHDLFIDAVSHEIFIYGDASYADLMEMYASLSVELNAIQLDAAKAGGEPDEAAKRRMSDLFGKYAQRAKMPDTVIGFKVSDGNSAAAQLARLEALLQAQLEMQPPQWHGRLAREKIGQTEFLTLKLDGTLIPWDQLPPPDEGVDQEGLKEAQDLVKKMTLVVSLGFRDGYLLLSIGDTSDHLKTLGQGKLLRDRPELAPLAPHAEKPITSVSYVSQRFAEKSNSLEMQIDNYVRMVEQLLPLSELDEQSQKELISDARSLAADLKKYIPRPGSQMGFSFVSPRGLEGYWYDKSQHPGADGSQRLSILDHVGGNPLAFAAGRRKYAPQDYDVLVKWLKRAVYHFERLGLDHLPPEPRAIYDQIRLELTPLVQRLDMVTRTMWIPAFKDGQAALVIDAKTTSKTWHQHMPPAKQPLPMLEIGLVYGVSDAGLVKRASSEYFSIAREAVKKLHAIVPDYVPEFDVPLPQARDFPEGTVFYYSLPAEWGVDTQIAPNAALSKEVLALSLVPKFGLRLLKKTPLVGEGPLANRDRPLAAAAHFHWAGLVEAVAPWIAYGSELAPVAELTEGEVSPQDVKEATAAVFDLLKCFKSMSSVSYFENEALVTHSEWHLVDQ